MRFLLDNIQQQIAVMRSMGKQPTKLVCDVDSWFALVDELGPLLPMYPVPLVRPPKIFGLDVEASVTPNFEVVE